MKLFSTFEVMKIKKQFWNYCLIRDTYPLLPNKDTKDREREGGERGQYSNYNELSPITWKWGEMWARWIINIKINTDGSGQMGH